MRGGRWRRRGVFQLHAVAFALAVVAAASAALEAAEAVDEDDGTNDYYEDDAPRLPRPTFGRCNLLKTQDR
jgi:hypothetical protein